MNPKDKKMGWWSTGAKAPARGEAGAEAKKACRFSPDGECPYRRDQFDCRDCVVEDGDVLPKT